jgi:hypothetical protein
MSYPSGAPGGYPGQPPQQGAPVFGQPPAPPNPLGRLGVPGLVALAVLALSLVCYFCSFGGWATDPVLILLAGGLLAGLSLLPRAPRTLPFATVLSLVGALAVLADAISDPANVSVPTAEVLVLVFGLVQAVAAVVALLLNYEIIKLAPRSAVPHGYPAAQTGYQQHQPAPGAPNPGAQATSYVAPASPPTPQSTQFLQQPGQLSHPPTPSGGFHPGGE